MAPAVLLWTGAAANPNWSDGNNWITQGASTHVSPVASDTVIFSSNLATNPAFASAFTSNNDIVGLSLNGIVLDSPGGATFTLGGL